MTNLPQYFEEKKLKNFVKEVFEKIGINEKQAQKASNVLITADLRGIDSHGVARLSGYVKQWKNKKLNVCPTFKIIHQTPSTAVLDGDAGLGLLVAQEAIKIAMQKAENVGTGWVAVQNSGHFGIAAYHALQAVEKNMIGWAMTHASALAVPTFSKEKLFVLFLAAICIPLCRKVIFPGLIV
jgi:LDH2 family malate/lactate/ureidoglycolate dehydrogenase